MSASPPLRVLYFAWLRERIGTGAEEFALPQGVTTVAGLVAWLRARGGGYEAAFGATASIRCAVNQEFADPDAALRPGDEVAFFPPVTGG
jgi:molybdopterin synthase sulfur carrier subunit